MRERSAKRHRVKEKSKSGERRRCTALLCHIMPRSYRPLLVLAAALFAFTFCSEKPATAEVSRHLSPGETNLPPVGSAADAPEYIRSLSLLYPQAEIYRVENRILQKTNHPLATITEYYKKTMAKHDFTLATRLEQSSGALLQFERAAKSEVVSVDISKLPYADNYLIRIGRSEVDYKRGKNP